MSIQYYLKLYHSFFFHRPERLKRMFNIKTILTEWKSVAVWRGPNKEVCLWYYSLLLSPSLLKLNLHSSIHQLRQLCLQEVTYGMVPWVVYYWELQGIIKFLSTLTWSRSMIDVLRADHCLDYVRKKLNVFYERPYDFSNAEYLGVQ